MQQRDISLLIKKAKAITNRRQLSQYSDAGTVGCALVTDMGNYYLGVNLDLPCGIGFCAEHSAVAAMVTNNETRIKAIVAYYHREKILSPCGRCRELLMQINPKNKDTNVILSATKCIKLSKLLPEHWQKNTKH